ncbi:hypothetical protein BB560_004197 [Smittium megazygosporum]|uniref:Uncharacterized protein n=1 Tax=Smittium megazygosporum TaxID=133381 RepID=A0A2T9Z9W2_9FUNG|nr:hypothetical protein BB560_004197 [Smittium megazygosporum]
MIDQDIFFRVVSEIPNLTMILIMILIILYLLALRQYSSDWRTSLESHSKSALYSKLATPLLRTISSELHPRSLSEFPKIQDKVNENNLSSKTHPSDKIQNDNLLGKTKLEFKLDAMPEFSFDPTFQGPSLPSSSELTKDFPSSDNDISSIKNSSRNRRISPNLQIIRLSQSIFQNKDQPNNVPPSNLDSKNSSNSFIEKLIVVPIIPIIFVYLAARVFWDVYKIIVFISVDLLLISISRAYTVFQKCRSWATDSIFAFYTKSRNFLISTLSQFIMNFIEISALWLYNTGFPVISTGISESYSYAKQFQQWFSGGGGTKIANSIEYFYFTKFLPVFNFIIRLYALISSLLVVITTVTYITVFKIAANSIIYLNVSMNYLKAAFGYLSLSIMHSTQALQVRFELLYARFSPAIKIAFAAFKSGFVALVQKLSLFWEATLYPVVIQCSLFFRTLGSWATSFLSKIPDLAIQCRSWILAFTESFTNNILQLCQQILSLSTKIKNSMTNLYYKSIPKMLIMLECATNIAFVVHHWINIITIWICKLSKWASGHVIYIYNTYFSEFIRAVLVVSHHFYVLCIMPLLQHIAKWMITGYGHARRYSFIMYESAKQHSVLAYYKFAQFALEAYQILAEYSVNAWKETAQSRVQILIFIADLFKNAYLVFISLVSSFVQYAYLLSQLITSVASKMVDDSNDKVRDLLTSTREHADNLVETWSRLFVDTNEQKSKIE